MEVEEIVNGRVLILSAADHIPPRREMRPFDARLAQLTDESRILGQAVDPAMDVATRFVALPELVGAPERAEVRVNIIAIDQCAQITHGLPPAVRRSLASGTSGSRLLGGTCSDSHRTAMSRG